MILWETRTHFGEKVRSPPYTKTSGHFQYGGQHGEELVCSTIFKKYDFLVSCEAKSSFKNKKYVHGR